MKKSLFAVLLCALLIISPISGAVWSASETVPGAGNETVAAEEPAVHIHAEHLYAIPANRPTCQSEGNVLYYICDCGTWFSDAAATQVINDRSSVVLPKSEHTPAIVMEQPATCLEEGHTAGFLCSVCGEPVKGYVAPQTVARKAHTLSESWNSDSDGHWHVCTVCGETLDYGAHVSGGAATATKDEVCTVCGYVIHRATGSTNTGGTVHPTPRPTPTPSPEPEPESSPAAEPELGDVFVTRIRFLDTGDTQIDDITVEQADGQAESCSVQLPQQTPESTGWFFEGWLCGIDGALYQPGDMLSFRWADIRQIDLTAEWSAVIGRGNYDLTAGMRYRFGGGSFQLDGDSSVYYGGSAFYVRENGNYTIR